jgi:hypothetical protein
VNADDLKVLADRASTVEGHGAQRLAEVHARIRTARRRRAVAAGGALVLVVTLGGVALSRSLLVEDAIGPSGQTPTPSTTGPTVPPGSRVGFIGLPPQGATPSGTTNAELVLDYSSGPGSGSDNLWVYHDGRLIVRRGGNLPEGANASSTGYLEQRLTPEGVETLRSYVLSNGEPLLNEPSSRMRLHVRDGDRLIDVEPAAGFDAARLMDPADWLPEGAWEYREPRAYVPSSFTACYGLGQQVARSRLLEPLPNPAADLLREGTELASDPPYGEGFHCPVVTTEEARAIVGWLQGAGLQQGDSTYNLNYWFELRATPNQPDPPEARIWFDPVLPDGQSTCSNCGG